MPILAQAFPVYQPAMRVINLISHDYEAVIITSTDHQYHAGMIVRINLPEGYGMQEVNQKTCTILRIIDPVTFATDIDTTNMSVFSVPTSFPLNLQYAQVTPVGELNTQLTDATRNVLPY